MYYYYILYLIQCRYCSHLVTPEIDSVVELLLTDLVQFQDRVYKNEPLKFKTKRRYVCGLREVNKHISLKRIKCVIFSPNLDRTKSPGDITVHSYMYMYSRVSYIHVHV